MTDQDSLDVHARADRGDGASWSFFGMAGAVIGFPARVVLRVTDPVDRYYGSAWPRRAVIGAVVLSLVGAFSFDSTAVDVPRGALLPWGEPFWQKVTELGESWRWIIVPLALGVLAWSFGLARLQHRCTGVVLALVVGGLIVHPFKLLAGRSRPKLLNEDGIYALQPIVGPFTESTYDYGSWPSGHSCMAGAGFMVLTVLMPRGWWLWLLPTAAIAASRVVVTAHYPTDTVAGFTLGAVTALAVFRHPAFRFMTRKMGLD